MSGYIVRNPLMVDNPLRIQPPPEARPNVLARPAQPNWAGAMDENARLYSEALARDRAEQVRLGYVDAATGERTPEGWRQQAQAIGGGFGPADIGAVGGFGGMVRRTPIEMVTLYHGTSPEGAAAIKSLGRINGPAFFSSRKSAAAEYAGGGPIVEVKVPKSALKVDFDLPGGQLLKVEEANGYSGNEGWAIEDYIRNGHSVGTEGHVSAKDATFHDPAADGKQ